ncbi:amidohydrolase family protein [Balneola sp. MJW-20]|uniref:amidohydrolase family protein n=1 Tax=Gracilimonas aurantiaca TaxID=3234185 RepID=UPI00346762EF
MPRLLLSIVFSLILFSACTDSNAQLDGPKAFTNVQVVDVETGDIIPGQTVIISGDRIHATGPVSEISIPENAEVIDGGGRYLMPGLAEMHGHVPPTIPPANFPDYYNEDYVTSTLFLYVAAGITTVRGMLGYEDQLSLKEKVNSGEWIGPNLYLAGPSFNGNSVSSPEQAEEKVSNQFEEGWDLLKVHPGLTPEEYDAMANTANELGIRFGGHVPADVGIVHALEMGQETMDHIDGYFLYLQQFPQDEWDPKMKEVVAMTKEAGAWIVPTQALWETIIGAGDYEAMADYEELKYIPEAVRTNYINWVENTLTTNANYNADNAELEAEWRQKILSEMYEQDVKILMGTDAPQLFSVPGFSIHRELPYMSDAGMSNLDIIRSGTDAVGAYFSNEDTFGLIKEGHRADLILLEGNPLEDLGNLKDHSGVMVQGRWYSRDMIDEKLAELEERYR